MGRGLIRIRIIQRPTETIVDGIRLDGFELDQKYEVGNLVGALLLAEGWAVPIPLDAPVAEPQFEEESWSEPRGPTDMPPNLTREHYPPITQDFIMAADLERRRRRRR